MKRPEIILEITIDKFGLQKLKNDIDNNRLEDITSSWN